MSGLEGPAISLGFKLAVAAGKKFFRTTEFERLCKRLEERFRDRSPYSAADFAAWSKDDAFAAALGRHTTPPHEFDREALVVAITPLVGPLDAETPAELFAGMVADAIREELRMAKTGDELLRLESDRIIQAVEASQEAAPSQEVTWAPPRAQYVVERLLTNDPEGAGRLRAAVEDRDLRTELPGLVNDPPAWLRDANSHVWEALARLCEVAGCWMEAQRAFLEAAERPGSDRARALMAASGSAGFAGDPEAAKALRERAERIDPNHPMVRIVAINEERDAATRLALLSELSPTEDAELDGLVEALRTTTLLDAGDFDAAEKAATAAAALAPWSAAVREAGPAVVVARNRERRRAGVATQRRELLEAAEAYRQLRDDLRQSRRYAESGGMLERVAECQNLAGRSDLAQVTLSEALREELGAGEVALMLAETAINAGAPDLADELVSHYEGEHDGAELLHAHLSLRKPEQRQAAVAVLDRRVANGDHEAARARMIAAIPETDEVNWSDAAEALVREREPALASFAKAEWYDRRGRPKEARRELARHTDDPRALQELMAQFGQQGEWAKAATPARALLMKDPDLETQVMVAQVLRRAGDCAEGEAVLRRVLDHPDVHVHEVAVAFDELATELLQQGRLREAFELAESVAARGYAEAGWVAAYVLARGGKLAEARERIEGLTPRGLEDATLAVDLHYSADPPEEALTRIIALADALPEPYENIELKATLALLRSRDGAVTSDLIERAGPVQFVERFPDSKALWKQEIADDEAALELLREYARARAQAANEAESHILAAGDRPVGTLAFAVGMSLAEVWAQLPALPLAYDSQPLDAEVAAAASGTGGPAIFETGALHSLHLLDEELTDMVLMELPLSVTAQATVEDLIYATTPDLSEGQDVVRQVRWSPEQKEIVFVEMTAEQAAVPRDTAQAMQRLAGRLQPAPPSKVEWPNDEEVQPAVVRAYAEVAELARRTGYPVYSDDRFFRAMLARAGIVTFGTVALLKSLRRNEVISTAQFSTAMASLDQRGALGLPPSTMQSTRPWPAVPNEYRWVTDLMEERLESTTQGPEELRARAAELRTEAERTTVEGFREAAWALAERYDQTAAR